MTIEGMAITGAIQFASRAKQVAASAKQGMRDVSKTNEAANGSALFSATNSLTDVASVARVEPLVLVDSACANLPYIEDVLQATHSMFAGYYLQAINLTATIGGVKVGEKLAPFNPNRSAFEGFKNLYMSAEDMTHPYAFRLPMSTDPHSVALEAVHQVKQGAFANLEQQRRARLERERLATARANEKAKAEARAAEKEADRQQRLADQDARDAKLAETKAQERADHEAKEAERIAKQSGMLTDAKAIDSINESSTLSVGKMYNVEIRENDISVKIPVAIRLLVNLVPSTSLVDIFTFRDSFDLSLKERWHGWRSGRLAFWKDLVLCNDLIDKYRKAAIKDKSGITQQMLDREASHVLASTKSNNVSYATASNIAVVSEETLGQIELRLNGKFSNSHVRHAMFSNTNLMILAVIDPHWEMVTFYHRGLASSSQVSVKAIKSGNGKGSGPDVTDIMKAYMLGNAPQLY